MVQLPSPEERDPEAPGCPSQGPTAPCCGRCEGCLYGKAGAEVEAAGGHPRRQADGGAAAGGGVETAAYRQGRI